MPAPTVGTPVVSSFASGVANTVAMPATVNSGDLLVAMCSKTLADASAAGWTSRHANPTAGSCGVQVLEKTADGTEGGTTVTFALGGAAASGWITFAVTGHDASPHTSVTSTEAERTTTGSTYEYASVTTPVADCLVLGFHGGEGASDNISTPPTGYTQLTEITSNKIGSVDYKTQASAGASGDVTDGVLSPNLRRFASISDAVVPTAGGGGADDTTKPGMPAMFNTSLLPKAWF